MEQLVERYQALQFTVYFGLPPPVGGPCRGEIGPPGELAALCLPVRTSLNPLFVIVLLVRQFLVSKVERKINHHGYRSESRRAPHGPQVF
ncbi:hypothetical protein THAOC_27821, partial [Thalassiosira oceanica]